MQKLNILIGNIGCGKSFLASRFAKQFNNVVINNDCITSMCSGGEYQLYDVDKKDVYKAIEITAVETALKNGFSVTIDRTNMDKTRRSRYIELGKRYGVEIIAYDFGCGTTKQLDRRIKNSHGNISVETWNKVFNFMYDSYESPSVEEGFDLFIKPPTNYRIHSFDFDGTIVEHKFPDIGKVIISTVRLMNKIWKNINSIIIISTCRSGNYEALMKEFLIKEKIPFDFINENPFFETGSRKLFAHEYYDDRNYILKEIEDV